MRLVAAARREGLELSVGDIFKHTLLELASRSRKSEQKGSVLVGQYPYSSLGIEDLDRFIREVVSPNIVLKNFGVVDVLPTTGTTPFPFSSIAWRPISGIPLDDHALYYRDSLAN